MLQAIIDLQSVPPSWNYPNIDLPSQEQREKNNTEDVKVIAVLAYN